MSDHHTELNASGILSPFRIYLILQHFVTFCEWRGVQYSRDLA